MLQPTHGSFSLGQTRSIVKDLFRPKPGIYWADFLLSMGIGGLCFGLVRRMPLFSWQQTAVFLVSCLAYYRAVLFIHELVHLNRNEFKAFRIVWNLLCGIPFLTPSFLYYTHVDHHRRKHYGTDHDGEYLPLGTQSPWAILVYLLQPLVIPALAVARFGLLVPICWVSPAVRNWIARHASSMVMDPSYVRPLPTREVRRVWRLQETLTFLFIVLVTVLMIRGRLHPFLIPQAYATALVILYVNSIRTLGAHRYTNAGGEMTFVEQLLDSVNYPHRPWITELWGPVGVRYHALHHLFPSLPYHAFPEAHRRLMAQLPADSPYRQTEERSLVAGIAKVWRLASASNAVKKQAEAATVPAPAAAPATRIPGAHAAHVSTANGETKPILAGPHTTVTQHATTRS